MARFSLRLPRLLRSSSILERLGALFITANFSVLFLAFAGFISVILVFSFRSFSREAGSIVHVLAASSRAAVIFDDAESARRVLAAIEDRSDFAWVAICSREGGAIAKSTNVLPSSICEQSRSGTSWGLSSAIIAEPIRFDGERIGLVIAEVRFAALYEQLLVLLAMTLALAAAVTLACRYFLNILDLKVGKPLRDMKVLAQNVSLTKDFSMRLPAQSDDELNDLIRVLNHMLEQLENRDRSLILAKEKAESADRAKSVFMASLSHEFRTPLHAIIGVSDELALCKINLEEKQLVETISAAGKSLLALVNDILDLAKIEAGRFSLSPRPSSLSDLIGKIRLIFDFLYRKKGVTLSYSVASSVPDGILVDDARLLQILINLLGNALKFTEPGGTVNFSITRRSTRSPSSSESVPMSLRDRYVPLQFSIEDDGLGIESELHEAIFEPFTQAPQANKAQQGTGLGLAIVSKIVKLMGGWIWVNSEVGKGSSFHFVLPVEEASLREGRYGDPAIEEDRIAVRTLPTVLKEQVAAIPDDPVTGIVSAASSVSQPGEKQTILVVDDNSVNRMLAVRLITRSGFRVLEATNGVQCLNILEKDRADLILMDINMPEMDGIEATRRIREREKKFSTPRIPIIALTASLSPDNTIDCESAGIDLIVIKPFQKEDLLDRIKHLISRSSERNQASDSSEGHENVTQIDASENRKSRGQID